MIDHKQTETHCVFHLCHAKYLDVDIVDTLQIQFGLRVQTMVHPHPRALHLRCENFVLQTVLREFLYHHAIDFSQQPQDKQEKKLFLSDMDATMIIGESLDEIAGLSGKQNEIAQITERAMRGELDFAEALRARLGLLAGLSKSQIMTRVEKTQFQTGAKTLLTQLNQTGLKTVLISGGFTLFSEYVAKQLGFVEHIANTLEFDAHECMTGDWVGDLIDGQTKLTSLKRLATEQQLDLTQTIAIGDGANDIPMLQAAGLGIAFMGKPATRAAVSAEIHTGQLENLIYLL